MSLKASASQNTTPSDYVPTVCQDGSWVVS